MIVNSSAELARLIDHTALHPETTEADVEQYCRDALDWSFAAVCISPLYVPRVAARLAGSPVKTCSVIGFPLGASPTAIKRAELDWVVEQGASEVDMVISISSPTGSAPRLLSVHRDILAHRRRNRRRLPGRQSRRRRFR
jgi:deoxyribose-phosphate aldolase